MSQRNLLRSQLKQAWRNTITTKYQNQLINSERGLQVYFCSELLQAFEENGVKRRIFVEPRVSARDVQDFRYPDIVICNTNRIIGIVELKYTPRIFAHYLKDLLTFDFVESHLNALTISNDRFLGRTIDNRAFPLAPDAVLCWAGVYSGQWVDLSSKISHELHARFLQLDAITEKDQDPIIYIDGKKD